MTRRNITKNFSLSFLQIKIRDKIGCLVILNRPGVARPLAEAGLLAKNARQALSKRLCLKFLNISLTLKYKLSRGEICVANFIPPANGSMVRVVFCSKFKFG